VLPGDLQHHHSLSPGPGFSEVAAGVIRRPAASPFWPVPCSSEPDAASAAENIEHQMVRGGMVGEQFEQVLDTRCATRATPSLSPRGCFSAVSAAQQKLARVRVCY